MKALARHRGLVRDAIPLGIDPFERTGNELLDSYMRQLTAPLEGFVSEDESNRYYGECIFHLERLIEAHRSQGRSTQDATQLAIQDFGRADFGSSEYLLHWYESQATAPLVKRLGRANSIVFCLFGMGTAIYLFLLQFAILFPSDSALRLGTSPARVHQFYPAQLPYPELSWQFLAVSIYPLLVPIGLGWFAGRTIPVRAPSAVFWGLLPIILVSLVVGILVQPDKTGLYFFVIQAFYWLPVSCLTAGFSSLLLRRSRRRGPA